MTLLFYMMSVYQIFIISCPVVIVSTILTNSSIGTSAPNNLIMNRIKHFQSGRNNIENWIVNKIYHMQHLNNKTDKNKFVDNLDWKEMNFLIKLIGYKKKSNVEQRHAWRQYINRKSRDKRISKRSLRKFKIQKFKESFFDQVLYFLGIKKRPTPKPKPRKTTKRIRSTRRPYPLRAWIRVEDGFIPPNAFIAFRNDDGAENILARGYIPDTKNDLIPGYIAPGEDCVRVAIAGKGRCITKMDILVGPFRWVYSSPKSYAHPESVVAGKEGNDELRICRRDCHDCGEDFLIVMGKHTRGQCVIFYGYSQTYAYTDYYELLVGNTEPWDWGWKTQFLKDIRRPGEASSESADDRNPVKLKMKEWWKYYKKDS